MLNVNRVVICKVCFMHPATEFVAVTLERVTSDRIVYQLLQLEICEHCAQAVNASMSNGERMAQALAGGVRWAPVPQPVAMARVY